MAADRLPLLHGQLERQTTRARLIQRSLVAFYSALGIFVATTVAIAVLNSIARNYLWVSVVFGLLGSAFMLYGSVLLIVESRMALSAVVSEIEFLSKVSRKYASEDLTKRPVGGPFTWLGRKIS